MTAEVNIPDEAVNVARDALRPEPVTIVEVERALHAAAPLIVAAELERLAESLPMPNHWDAAYQAGRYDAHQLLVNRAVELRLGKSR